MIRKNALFCKLFHIKISSKSIFDSYMAKIRPELETCPVCKSRGNCIIHDYYDRSLIDFHNGERRSESLCVMRVYCTGCGHAHAILPDVIVPYSHYSLLFILSALAEFFRESRTAASICDKYDISPATLAKWVRLWHSHKKAWLGVLSDIEQTDASFSGFLWSGADYSLFGMAFIRKTAVSFLQSHRNPVAVRTKNAHYRQSVFEPDLSIW